MAVLDHLIAPRLLTYNDLLIALFFSMFYLFFYLFVLDANGFHLYIILSPRPWWSSLVYLAILGFQVSLWIVWCSITQAAYMD